MKKLSNMTLSFFSKSHCEYLVFLVTKKEMMSWENIIFTYLIDDSFKPSLQEKILLVFTEYLLSHLRQKDLKRAN